MTSPAGLRFRLLASVVSVILLVFAIAGAWFYWELRASLPRLDGAVTLGGLKDAVTVSRDAIGVPRIRGRSRPDVTRALGYLHGQERFFQMDLLRRRSAGELSELFGKAALPIDTRTRVHGFRALATQVYARLPADEREILESYAAGVNAGLSDLGQKPFEYLVLRSSPQPWGPVDSILVIYSMTLDLQDSTGSYELSLATLRDQLGFAGVAFFAPVSLPDDAAIDNSTGTPAPIPGEKIIDLRKKAAVAARTLMLPASYAREERDPEFLPGSNSFALSGAHTATGAALLANDPHLDLGVPNIWYRATLEWEQPATCRVSGVTLPGLPAVVIGSNEHIAWGLTDAYADTGDVVAVEVNAVDHSLYKLPGSDELVPIEQRRETIKVKGQAPVTVEIPWTHWGPVVGKNSAGRPLVYHWLAHDPAATDFSFRKVMEARDVGEAIALAHRAGIPAQNFVVADVSGKIAWTIVGRLPKRVGFDGRLPTSWSYGDRRWDGMVAPESMPTVIEPPNGRLWTANNRVVGADFLAVIGDGGFAAPARASQIRDDLSAIEHGTPSDLRKIQLDDRALFLEAWRGRLLAVLTPQAVAQKPARAELRRAVEKWEGRAGVDSVSYCLVRAFRSETAELAFTPIFAGCVEAMPGFDWHRFHYEAPLDALLREKPLHLLDPRYAGWDDLQLAAADAVIADLDRQGVPLERATWGQHNTARILHPFGHFLPAWMTGWLNMPADPLPGDVDMPRVQAPAFGASMRLVVSPGHESEGLLHMSGGQSGHPLSPYYRAGHHAWVAGEPTPLLPGPAVHTLILNP
ncbi:MAG: Penicillin amidase [Verrucomicrobia bacterium]|nr:Penicillin amidase [Verrucomicrobiota bacterium]